VKMDKPVDPENGVNKGNVERWLLEIEAIQWDSIRTLTVHSLEEYAKLPRKVWLLNWPAQVILGVSCVYWTQEVTTALSSGGGRALADCNAKLDGQLREIVELVRGKLNKLQRKTLGALTTIDVHNRDVVAKMVDLGTREVPFCTCPSSTSRSSPLSSRVCVCFWYPGRGLRVDVAIAVLLGGLVEGRPGGESGHEDPRRAHRQRALLVRV